MNILIISFLLITSLVFIIVAYAKTKNTNFYLGKGNYGPWISAMSIVAAFTGGGAILNTSKLAESYGFWALADVFPTTIGLLLAVVLVHIKFFGQTFSEKFFSIDSKLYDKMGVNLHYFQIGFLYILVIGAQFRGTVAFSEAIGLPGWIGVSFSALVVATYAYRGFSAVTRTDVVQFLLLIPMYFVILLTAAEPNSKLAPSTISQTAMPLSLVLALALPIFFLPISQEIHQRGAAAQDSKAVGWSYVIAAIFCLTFGLLLVISIAKRPSLSVLGLLKGNNVVASIAVAIGIYSAILSTIDTATNISSHALQKLPIFSHMPSWSVQFFILALAAIIFMFFPTILSLILFALFVYIAGPALTFISIYLGIHPRSAAKVSLFFSSVQTFIQFRAMALVSIIFPDLTWLSSLLKDTVLIGLLLIVIQLVITLGMAFFRRVPFETDIHN